MTSTPPSLPTPDADETGKKLLATTDAVVWAEEFCRLLAGAVIVQDESTVEQTPDVRLVGPGTMITWLGNALETGRNAGRKETCPHDNKLRLAEDLECCMTCGFLIEPVPLEDKFVEGFQEGRTQTP